MIGFLAKIFWFVKIACHFITIATSVIFEFLDHWFDISSEIEYLAKLDWKKSKEVRRKNAEMEWYLICYFPEYCYRVFLLSLYFIWHDMDLCSIWLDVRKLYQFAGSKLCPLDRSSMSA